MPPETNPEACPHSKHKNFASKVFNTHKAMKGSESADAYFEELISGNGVTKNFNIHQQIETNNGNTPFGFEEPSSGIQIYIDTHDHINDHGQFGFSQNSLHLGVPSFDGRSRSGSIASSVSGI
jgi:hypothetical protein